MSIYPVTATLQHLVTVHGHYRDSMKTQLSAPDAVKDDVRLACIGQVRPYKNIPELIRIVSTERNVLLNVIGTREDEALSQEIEALSHRVANISLNLQYGVVQDAELEAAIDASHAVVLPYRNILNSGSAIFALSRHRRVLAPRMGSLMELQDSIGPEWVYLYDGEFTAEILRDFVYWISAHPSICAPDLSAHEWAPIGQDVFPLYFWAYSFTINLLNARVVASGGDVARTRVADVIVSRRRHKISRKQHLLRMHLHQGYIDRAAYEMRAAWPQVPL